MKLRSVMVETKLPRRKQLLGEAEGTNAQEKA
jgi:hypothetical protein